MTKTAENIFDVERPGAGRFELGAAVGTVLNSLAKQRCRLIHRSISRPVQGKYRCWTCLREFDTEW